MSVFLGCTIENKTLKFACFPIGKIAFEYLDQQILNRRVPVKGVTFQGSFKPFGDLNRHGR